MEHQPPISTRETNELLAIIQPSKDWESIAIEQARIELHSRGVAFEELGTTGKIHKNRKSKRLFFKGNTSYSGLEFFLLVVFSPKMVLLLNEIFILGVEPELKNKKAQGWAALFLGFALWILVLSMFK